MCGVLLYTHVEFASILELYSVALQFRGCCFRVSAMRSAAYDPGDHTMRKHGVFVRAYTRMVDGVVQTVSAHYRSWPRRKSSTRYTPEFAPRQTTSCELNGDYLCLK